MDTVNDENSNNGIDANDKSSIDLAFLKQSFPDISEARLKRRLEACKGDVEKATDELLNERAINEMNVDVYDQAYIKKKTRTRKKHAAEGELEQQIELAQKVLKLPIDQAKKVYEENGGSFSKALLSQAIKTTSPKTTVMNVKPSETKPVIKPEYGVGITKDLEDDLELHRANRDYARTKAQELFKKADSNPLYRSAAGVYSEIASNHSKMSESARNGIFYNTIEQQSSTNYVDCHGIPLDVAVDYCTVRLYRWAASRSGMPLKIITGAGRHSAGGVPKIKNAIRKKLADGGFDYEENISFFMINGFKK